MRQKLRLGLFAVLFVALLSPGLAPRAEAGVSQAVMALAGPLAQQFGVPVGGVTQLLEGGMSLESVTQLLLVSKKSSSSLDSVTKVFNDSGKDIDKTAEQLDVDPKAYSQKKVDKKINKAKKAAEAAATEKANESATAVTDAASSTANDAAASATEDASKAMGSALGGTER